VSLNIPAIMAELRFELELIDKTIIALKRFAILVGTAEAPLTNHKKSRRKLKTLRPPPLLPHRPLVVDRAVFRVPRED